MISPPADVASALEGLGIDEERIARLSDYVAVLDRWRQSINLIGPASVPEIWRRHVLDCAQLWPHLKDPEAPCLDFGAGAGLPGLILAILGASNVSLADSDQRKGVFLRTAARACGVTPTLKIGRFETLFADAPRSYGVVVGRAVAPLPRLLPFVRQALSDEGYALLHKGQSFESELTDARKSWTMRLDKIPSITAADAVILKIWELRSRHE